MPATQNLAAREVWQPALCLYEPFFSVGTRVLDLGLSRWWLVVENLSASAGNINTQGLIPGSGRSPGGGNGNPPQYCSLDNPMDRGTWQTTVHEVTKSRKQLSDWACRYTWTILREWRAEKTWLYTYPLLLWRTMCLLQWLLLLWSIGLGWAGFSSCSSWALEHSSCGAWT